MGNCLVTKLKEVVQNDSLPRLGEFRFKVVSTAANQEIAIVGPSFDDWSVDGNTTQLVMSTPSHYNGYVQIVTPGVHFIRVKNKYSITKIEATNGATITFIGGFEDIKYLPLTSLVFTSTGETNLGNIANLANIPTLTNIQLRDNTINGDISDLLPVLGNTVQTLLIGSIGVVQRLSDLGCFRLITAFGYGGTSNTLIQGAIEDFVQSRRSIGETEGSITQRYLGGSGMVTWKGSVIENIETNVFSWTATTITYNGETINA